MPTTSTHRAIQYSLELANKSIVLPCCETAQDLIQMIMRSQVACQRGILTASILPVQSLKIVSSEAMTLTCRASALPWSMALLTPAYAALIIAPVAHKVWFAYLLRRPCERLKRPCERRCFLRNRLTTHCSWWMFCVAKWWWESHLFDLSMCEL